MGKNRQKSPSNNIDFSKLNYYSLMTLTMNDGDIYDPGDQALASEEFNRREETGELNDEGFTSIEDDITKNGLVFIETKESKKKLAKIAIEQIAAEKTPEKKAEIVIDKTYKELEKTFVANGFSLGFVDARLRELDAKNLEDNKKEGKPPTLLQRASEPLTVQLLGVERAAGAVTPRKSFLPRVSYSTWASEFDDKLRSTDIVYFVKRNDVKNEWSTFSIDVTTAASDSERDGVKHKFETSAYGHGSKKVQQWANEIVFCRRRSEYYTEESAPHFVIGLSTETYKNIAAGIELDAKNRNAIIGINPESDTEFMVASELVQEIAMQKLVIVNTKSEHYKKIDDFQRALEEKLEELLGCSLQDPAFNERFKQKVEEMKTKDIVYKRVIDEIDRYYNQYTKNNTTGFSA